MSTKIEWKRLPNGELEIQSNKYLDKPLGVVTLIDGSVEFTPYGEASYYEWRDRADDIYAFIETLKPQDLQIRQMPGEAEDGAKVD